MGIEETLQRANLGRRLYRRIEERLQDEGVRMIIADTEGDNEGAISFFKTMGFSPRSEHVWLAKTMQRPTNKQTKSKQVVESVTDFRQARTPQIVKKPAIPYSPVHKKRASRKLEKPSSDNVNPQDI